MTQVCGAAAPTTVTMTMTAAFSEDSIPATPLAAGAAAVGLTVLATASWPESDADDAAPALAGFVVSSFSPLAAEAARRCLSRRAAVESTAGERELGEHEPNKHDPGEHAQRPVTAVILVSSLGDLASAVHVAGAVDSGGRIGPLLFFQSVPNAVAGHVATKWRLTGPVVCVGAVAAGLEIAALLIEDGDADQALLVRIEQAGAADTALAADTAAAETAAAGTAMQAGTVPGDRADAVLLGAGPLYSEGEVT